MPIKLIKKKKKKKTGINENLRGNRALAYSNLTAML